MMGGGERRVSNQLVEFDALLVLAMSLFLLLLLLLLLFSFRHLVA